jgi:hypothetical protein
MRNGAAAELGAVVTSAGAVPDLTAAADVLGRAADDQCPGCGRLLERRDWCFQCHYFDIATGRAHYCGRNDCYCRALRGTMRREVLDGFAEAFARRVLREEER